MTTYYMVGISGDDSKSLVCFGIVKWKTNLLKIHAKFSRGFDFKPTVDQRSNKCEQQSLACVKKKQKNRDKQ